MERVKITTALEREVAELLKQEENHIRQLKSERKNAKTSKVYMRYRNKRPYFTEYSGNKEKGITKNPDRIFNLLNREQIDQYIKASRHNCALLKRSLKEFMEVDITRVKPILDEFHMRPAFYSRQQMEWMKAGFKSNSYRLENLKFVTTKGVKVRSKSELTIANRLEHFGIIYRYDSEFDLQDRKVYPDFIIKKGDGSLIVWEHFGLMSDEEYYDSAMKKIGEYRAEGFVQHKNLICTWEEDIKSTKDIDGIIKKFLFR